MTGASFGSDNHAGVHPDVLAAMVEADAGWVPAYGDDPVTAKAQALFRGHFGEHVEVFPAPRHVTVVTFTNDELNSMCPVTQQPDLSHVVIRYVPDQWCIESKSLKLYLWSFRDEGHFHEAVTNRVLDDIVAATRPRFVRVTARWYVRGGIYTDVVAEYRDAQLNALKTGLLLAAILSVVSLAFTRSLPGRDETDAAAEREPAAT